ncbi:recombinase family protein [Tsuneonella troitsensis]|uniref:recombinase family protein n=1 Tax=Tsuneonella troitsensis TaxID=292222 RepID=UPI00070C7EB0|nr:recombinase family protein [Tsuneonella troitsensis]
MTKSLRCAIYTRKSSDEGLEQSFNSLDAQREAGEAYVRSQAHEGWKLLPARYDDGGFSGGTMERPGLRKLLADVEAGLIDVVVVYKIDRLTRSLADFARIVELFDKREVSFVSVTQAFNTTSSMGRLTLNVLLSFAQFEREVTGERIRDKIAASKKRGMWMGGVLPLGYDLPEAGSRTLRVNEVEAQTVRQIYGQYLELGSVHALQRELEAEEIRSKRHVTLSGKALGGKPFSRGALFHLLRNRIYLGQIVHKGEIHEGGHDAVVSPELFDAVQTALDGQARRHRASTERRVTRAPLTGKLFDAAGEPMSPTFSQGRGGRVYRYYVSASLQQGAAPSDSITVRRLPAGDIERIIGDAIQRWLTRGGDPFEHLRAARLAGGGIELELNGLDAESIASRLAGQERITHASTRACRVLLPLVLPLRGGRRLVIAGSRSSPRPDRTLVEALRRAHRMLSRDRSGLPTIETSPRSPYERKVLRLAFLAPDIQRDILEGRQPRTLNLEQLLQTSIPPGWAEQRKTLGWRSAR